MKILNGTNVTDWLSKMLYDTDTQTIPRRERKSTMENGNGNINEPTKQLICQKCTLEGKEISEMEIQTTETRPQTAEIGIHAVARHQTRQNIRIENLYGVGTYLPETERSCFKGIE